MHPNANRGSKEPDRDDSRTEPPEHPPFDLKKAHFSRALVAACIGLFIVEILDAMRRGESIDGLILGWRGQYWPLFGPWVADGQWWLIPGTVVEHGGVLHLFFNLSLVWNLGRVYEVAVGTKRLLLVSLVGMLGSSLIVLLFGFFVPTVGASGMLLGWLGAMLPIATKAHRRELTAGLIQIALISLLPIVSWQGHLGGFLAGAAAGGLLWLGPTWFRYGAPVLITVLAIGNLFAARLEGEFSPDPRRAPPTAVRETER